MPVTGKTTLAGLMPADKAVANAAAAAAVTAWVVNGAQNHGVGPGGQTSPGGADAGAGDSGAKDAGTHDAGGSDASTDAGPSPAGTFTDVYENWIGPEAKGNCSNTYCHNLATSKGAKASGFVCGSSQADCYAGLVEAGLIDTSDPGSSLLGNPSASPLGWFGSGGPMPEGDNAANPAGAAAITAWIKAGAKND